MKPVAFIYTCRNPGQAALLWAHQPPPFGHGWIDVKRVGLVREDEVEALAEEVWRHAFETVGEDGYLTNQELRKQMTARIRELLK